MSFTSSDLARYQRHFALAGFGPAAQEKLRRGTVLVIGAGGLSCPALLYLAAAGVGRILVIDPDRVEASNLQRQVLFAEAEIGEFKAVAAAHRLAALNSGIVIEPRVGRFSRANALTLVGASDVVVDGSDNFATRYLANDACVLANKPLVYGAVQGFAGQLSVFNWRGGPTYRCLFPEPPPAGAVPNCAEAGVLGVLPGIIGTAQACEAIKLLTGIGEPLSGRLLLWDALTMETRTVALPADPRSREITELPPEGYGETCAAPAPGIAEMDTAGLRAARAAEPAPQLIDVRESWERRMGSIEPSVHIPLGLLERGEAEGALAGLDPAALTVVYCAVGVRSLRAAEILRDRYGFKQPVNLRDGISRWHE
ncbi:MAG TPA: HesA/MoeB/ThiF family protein [Opitutaceae bacterium]|nr:HesA/MoeB/ThiF family protein [Opitutaceae bacterium]